MAETIGWPVGHLKGMMSSREFSTWAAEYMLRAEDEEEAGMQARVNAGAKLG